MKYFLKMDIQPEKHFIKVEGKIVNPTGSLFYLNEHFNLIRASSNGNPIQWDFQKSQPHPPFDQVSRPLMFESIGDEITFEYEGCLPEIIADVNQIGADTIELSYYSGWYPKPENFNITFDFDMNFKIPSSYEIASNGKVLDYNHIVSVQKDSDIAFFASTRVQRYEYCESNITCTFLCPEDMLAQMKRRAEDLVEANKLFSDLFGSLDPKAKQTEIISVFRPEGGWGYKRGNVTFMPAEYGRGEKYYTADFHELSHGWWSIADVTTNDWINEGGAEFSAYTAARHIYGEEYADQYISDCMKAIEAAKEAVSIVDTDSKSPDRLVNHYTKTLIMFVNAQKKLGDERVYHLLASLFQTFKGTRNATTNDFLSLCDCEMRSFFEKYLFWTDWNSRLPE